MMAESLPKMKLWYYPKYRSTRCVWLVKELGIEDSVEYRYVPIGPPPPAPEREEFRRTVHPHGTVPALEVEGRPPLLESGAICLYLADLCGRLAPELSDRAEYYNWTFYCTSTLDVALMSLTVQWMFKPEGQCDQGAVDKAIGQADICLDRLDQALKGRKYILGDRFTAADCVVGYCVSWASVLNKDRLLASRPNLLSYLATISTRPALQQAMALDK
ncbi:uncharacterized protein LOC143292652 [Babylonia areolata]|uniref:uncharacterized protein LOC143292652 n=1 Tax=Babylonia areolata TaxID=304850 RepID=UPI003FD2AB70